MKFIKFHTDIENCDPLFQFHLMTKPLDLIRRTSRKTSFEKWAGINGYGESYYRTKPFVQNTIVKWCDPVVYDIPEIDTSRINVYKAAAKGHAVSVSMEDFFGPKVAVGDLIVPLAERIVFRMGRPYDYAMMEYGFVCGEGMSWGVVYLDNGEEGADCDTTPHIGDTYGKLAEPLLAELNNVEAA